MTTKLVLGNEEWCSLPEIGLPLLKAKIDPSTQLSSLHAFNISPFEKNGRKYIHFDIHPIEGNHKITQRCEGLLVKRSDLRANATAGEKSFLVRTTLKISETTWEIDLLLTNRSLDGYRLVLGKDALKSRILLDPDQSFLLGQVSDAEILTHYAASAEPKKHLKIAILANNPKLYSNKRLMEIGEQRGHEMRFLDVRQTYMNVHADSPEVYYRDNELLDDIDAIIPRIDPSVTFYGCAVVRQFQTIGAYCLNDSSSITQSRDKLHSLQLLSKQRIPMPTTGFANSSDDATDIIRMVGGAPLVIKLLEGTQGKGVVLAETNKAAESVITAFKSLNANILVQEYIKEAQGQDIRCFVIDGKVVGTMQRQASGGDFRANLHLGGTASAIKITAEERKIAINATKAMGLKVAGVDLIRSKDGPKVLEINSSPGLEGIEKITGKNIAGLMIESIEKQLKFQKDN